MTKILIYNYIIQLYLKNLNLVMNQMKKEAAQAILFCFGY
jgi:hypothetical protein